MKINKLFFIIILICVIISNNCNNYNKSKEDNMKNIPSETSKIIITNNYLPIFHNGEWICGKHWNMHPYLGDTTYVDKYNNILLRLKNNQSYQKYIYADSKKRKLIKIYNGYKETLEDSTAFLFEEESYTESGLIIDKYKTLINNEYNMETVDIINPQTNKVVHSIEYKKDCKIEYDYLYNKNNKLISQIIKIDNKLHETMNYNYDLEGNLIEERNYLINGDNLELNNFYSKKYNGYEYNHKGDWIKRMEFSLKDNKISMITIRNIIYK